MTSPRATSRPPASVRDDRRFDLPLYGGLLILLFAGAGWLVLAAESRGGAAFPTVGVLAITGLALGMGHAVTRLNGWIVPAAATVAAGAFALLRLPVLFEHPTGGPLGYSNAAGSLFMLAAAASLMVVARAPNRGVLAAGCAAALAFALVPWLNGSVAAAALACLLPLALLAREARYVRLAVILSAAAVLASQALVVVLGATYDPDAAPDSTSRAVDGSLTERRVMLWSDAIDLFVAHPITGVGPGRFPSESATARANPDTPWPHNEVLHFASESGIVGLLFVLGLFAWGFARLWWGAGDTGTAVAALALGAALVHANIDYTLHYPAVPVLLALLVGAGASLPDVAGGEARPPGERVSASRRSRSRA